jgi:hypothetical protein
MSTDIFHLWAKKVMDEQLEYIDSAIGNTKPDTMGHIFGNERCHCGLTIVEFYQAAPKEKTKCDAFEVNLVCKYCGIDFDDKAINETCIGNSGKMYITEGWIRSMLAKRTRPETVIKNHHFIGTKCFFCHIDLVVYLSRHYNDRIECPAPLPIE